MSSGSDTILAQLPSSAPDLVVDGRPDTTPDVIDGVAYARLYGEPLFRMPTDLYIPPDALEVFLEAFEGPLDLLLYLIRKQNFRSEEHTSELKSLMRISYTVFCLKQKTKWNQNN